MKHKERNTKANNWKQHFDKEGNELTDREWIVASRSEDTDVAKTELAPGLVLHTMFWGKDWGTPSKPRPQLFESMLFDESEDAGDMEVVGEYTTEEEALAGHNRLVEELRVALGHSEEVDGK